MSGLSISRLTPEEIRIGIVAAIIIPDRGAASALRQRLLPLAVGQHHALCGAVHGMDIVPPARPTTVSLATAAFFGIGTYAVGLGIDILPFPLLVLIGAVAAALLAGIVGAATLRISGVYFVVFTLGLAELVRQLVSWSQSKFAGSMGLYVFTDFREGAHLLDAACPHGRRVPDGVADQPLAARLRNGGDWQRRDRRQTFGHRHGTRQDPAVHDLRRLHRHRRCDNRATLRLHPAALRLQPDDLVPRGHHGAARRHQAPVGGRWSGVIPFTILMDIVSSRFPNHTYIVMGFAFLAIVYLLPNGVTGRLEELRASLRNRYGKREIAKEEKPA